MDAGWPKADQPFVQVSYQEVRETLPTVAGAEYVNDDEICMTCHEAYVKSFANNVHRQGKCESCHGPASKHVEGRGKEPGLIFSFKQGSPAARAEACLRCHEENQCAVGCRWRTSKHAHCNVTCVDCHRGHYNVPPGTPATTAPGDAALLENSAARLTSFHMTANAPAADPDKAELPSLRGTSRNLARSPRTSAIAATATRPTCSGSPARTKSADPTASTARPATTRTDRSRSRRGATCA